MVALVIGSNAAWATPPSVTTDLNDGDVFATGAVVIAGTASDDNAIFDVQIALRDATTGQWLQDTAGSWGSGYRRVSTNLASRGAPTSTWSIDVDFLSAGSYGFHPVAVDAQGELTPVSGRPWRNFVVASGANESPLVFGDITSGEILSLGTSAPTGQATDDETVVSVEIAVRSRDTGEWLTEQNSFAAGFRWVGVAVDAPGTAAVNWTYSTALPVGRYGYFARATDDQGVSTAPADRTWTNFEIAATGASDGGYLTILFGRSQWAHATQCTQSDQVFDLGQIADYLGLRGLSASGTTPIGHISEDPGTRNCPWQNEIASSWNDLAELRDHHGWTFVGDSQPTYNAEGDILKTRPKMNELDPTEQYRQSCGSLEVLEANGHTRGWGLFAFAGNQLDLDAQNDIVSTCYAFSRRYSAMLNSLDTLDAPWFVNTTSVPGGNCNDPAEPCYDHHLTRPGWSSRHYMERDVLLKRLSAGDGTWRIVQLYRLVEGARLESEASDDDHYWDCTSPEPSQHWTSKDELYCANDFRWAIDNLSPAVNVVDAAFIADLIGRGNPGG